MGSGRVDRRDFVRSKKKNKSSFGSFIMYSTSAVMCVRGHVAFLLVHALSERQPAVVFLLVHRRGGRVDGGATGARTATRHVLLLHVVHFVGRTGGRHHVVGVRRVAGRSRRGHWVALPCGRWRLSLQPVVVRVSVLTLVLVLRRPRV